MWRYLSVVGLVLVFGAPAGLGVAKSRRAIEWPQSGASQVIAIAESHLKKGESAYQGGQYDQARREFDDAVDTILLSEIDIRESEELKIYYRTLIEKINRYQIAAIEQKDGGFSEQRHEPSPLDKIASLSEADLEEVASGDDSAIGRAGLNFHFTSAPAVRQFVGYFAHGRGREVMIAGFRRSVRYRELARRIFKEEGVPTDLVWLAQIESGWNPYALSWASARGIWQFVPSTGVRFGLSQNYWIDERSDPEKSTRAAARYLKWLGQRYRGNWELALAAYNSGEGTVDAAIARSGSKDFWQLRSGFLPQETRNYVPAILAVMTIAKTPDSYGFEIPPAYRERYVTQMVAKQTDLRALAKKMGVSYSSLLDLNPALQRGVTPPGKHLLRIPSAEPETETNQAADTTGKRSN
jgi:membrane-bound lytic murein transglycosylase D